jgi:hypothetical protein
MKPPPGACSHGGDSKGPSLPPQEVYVPPQAPAPPVTSLARKRRGHPYPQTPEDPGPSTSGSHPEDRGRELGREDRGLLQLPQGAPRHQRCARAGSAVPRENPQGPPRPQPHHQLHLHPGQPGEAQTAAQQSWRRQCRHGSGRDRPEGQARLRLINRTTSPGAERKRRKIEFCA